MARSKAQQREADRRALLRRYQNDLDAIRRSYVEQARSLGLNDVETDLRIRAREAESDYAILSRRFRKEVSILRKKGILSKKTKATTARPTRYLRNVLDTFSDVVKGQSVVKKVTPRAAKRLKEEGYRVKNRRVITSPSYRINPNTGELTRAKAAHVIETIDLTSDVEEQVKEIWESLGPNEYMTFDVFGNFSNTYRGNQLGLDDLLLQLLKYNPEVVPQVSVLYFPNREAETAHIREVMMKKYDQQEANRRRRRREYKAKKRAQKRGIRTSRGH